VAPFRFGFFLAIAAHLKLLVLGRRCFWTAVASCDARGRTF
jgi:hypothetical protein